MVDHRRDESSPGAVRLKRDDVYRLAREDWADAEIAAREIVIPWYRVQALAAVAGCAPASEIERLLSLAIEIAASERDEYRRTAVLAWPLEAALNRQRSDIATRLVQQFEQQIQSVEPLLS